jgi:5S rRNA maturation endonuclease (ribonuclease M5)
MLSAHEVASIMGDLTKVHSVESSKVVCHCPMAPWEHIGGSDASPSFAVMRGRTGWWVNCLACRYRKTLEGMIWDIMGRTRKPLTKIIINLYHQDREDPIKEAPLEEITYNPLGSYRGRNEAALKRPEYASGRGIQTNLFGEVMPQVLEAPEERPDINELFRWESAQPPMEYVQKRGITYDAYKEWRLGHDPVRRRLMFPVFNRDGSYVGFTGRLYHERPNCFGCGAYIMEDKINGVTGEVSRRMAINCSGCRRSYAKYKHFKGKWRRHVVYGLHRQVPGPIVVTEGTMDAIRLWMLGVARPVCILGANLSPNQVTELRDACDMSLEAPIIFMGDGDDAGREMARDGVERMKKAGVNAFLVDCPADDPDNMTYEQARAVLPASAFR